MAGKKQANSLMSQGGVAIIAVDVPTKALFKKQAGALPLAHYLRELAKAVEKANGNGQLPLPGEEHLVVPSSMSAMAAEMAALRESYSNLELAICAIARFFGRTKPLDTGIWDFLKTLVGSPDDRSQVQMNFTERRAATSRK